MKATRITINTSRGASVKFNRALPGLFWVELVTLVAEWHKFENGRRGTRFDKWLTKTKGRA
jgi:hypothetical protein